MKEKILFVMNEPMHKGGSQGVMMNIVRNLSQEFSFDILLFSAEKSFYDDEFVSYGGKIFREPHYNGTHRLRKRADIYIRGKRVFRAVSNCLMGNGPYKAIHCMNGFEAAVAMKAAYQNGIKIRITHSLIVTDTNGRFLRTAYNRILSADIERYATHKISVSEQAQLSNYRFDERCRVITPSYNDKIFNGKNYPQEAFNEPHLIQIGSYSANKNQLFSVRVLQELLKFAPTATLQFVGFDPSGEYVKKVQEYVYNNELGDHVFFFEHDANLPALLNSSTHFLLPSLHEGFGIVLVEAQAMGVPCFVSDTVSNSADAGGCTFLPLTGGAELWASAIMESYYKTQGQRQYYDCRCFSDGEIAKEYAKVYSSRL